MPLPLLIVAIGSAVSGVVGVEVFDVIKHRVKKSLDERWRDYLNAALDNLGIKVDPELGITDETMTKVLNEQLLAGSGLELASLLDREKMLRGFEKLALNRVATELGLPAVDTVGGVRAAVQDWLVDQLGAEIASEVGDVIDAAKPLPALKKRIDKTPEAKWNDPVDFTPKGVKNRERQRAYRARHKKMWVPR